MTESRIKRLWKNRISQQLTGFHFNTCISPNISKEEDQEQDSPPEYAATNTIINNSNTSHKAKKKLWRKPLPTDCPVFDFSDSKDEKTIVIINESLLDEKTEIPTRHESRYYEKIPNLEAELDRACKNKKAVLLTKLLQKQRH